MTSRRKFSLAIAVVAAIAQFYPVAVRDNPPASARMAAPPNITRILRRACYDCHSNETRWPWYSYVAPASWLVNYDVSEARQQMNFSTWPRSMPQEIDCLFKRRVVERAAADEMPPSLYLLLHPSATLTDEDVTELRAWAVDECAPEPSAP